MRTQNKEINQLATDYSWLYIIHLTMGIRAIHQNGNMKNESKIQCVTIGSDCGAFQTNGQCDDDFWMMMTMMKRAIVCMYCIMLKLAKIFIHKRKHKRDHIKRSIRNGL